MPTKSLNIFGSFTGTGVSDDTQSMRAAPGDFNVNISGTWTGTIELQRDSSLATGEAENWQTVENFTGTSVPATDFVAKTGSTAGHNSRYRFEATALSSGEAFFNANQ